MSATNPVFTPRLHLNRYSLHSNAFRAFTGSARPSCPRLRRRLQSRQEQIGAAVHTQEFGGALRVCGLTKASAISSADDRYCYRQTYEWDSAKPSLGWVLLTGSHMDSRHVDPALRRCVLLARSWGYGSIVVRNLYGLMTSDPRTLDMVADPIGPANDDELAQCWREDLTVLAWGAGADPQRAHAVAAELRRHSISHGSSLAVLGWDNDGQPQAPQSASMNATPNCFTPDGADGMNWTRLEKDDPRWGALVGAA